jgi:hypothetical protein
MKKSTSSITYVPGVVSVTDGVTDAPWPIAGIQGVVSSLSPAAGEPSAFVMTSCTLCSPRVGGCDGEVRTSACRFPESLVTVMSGASEKFVALEDEPPLHATETKASADTKKQERSSVIEPVACGHLARESMRQIDAGSFSRSPVN